MNTNVIPENKGQKIVRLEKQILEIQKNIGIISNNFDIIKQNQSAVMNIIKSMCKKMKFPIVKEMPEKGEVLANVGNRIIFYNGLEILETKVKEVKEEVN